MNTLETDDFQNQNPIDSYPIWIQIFNNTLVRFSKKIEKFAYEFLELFERNMFVAGSSVTNIDMKC